MFIVKKHESEESGKIIAIIDEDILGKEFEEGKKFLDLKSDFYKGTVMSKEEVLKIIITAKHLNVVGKNIVALLKEKGFIEETLEVAGIPFAQVTFV